MIPDTINTAVNILISAIIFTTGFLSVRIHGERLRLLEGRDSVENRLADADATGKLVLRLKTPSPGDFDLGQVGAMLLIGNFGFLIAMLLLEIYAGFQARWVLAWPADPHFWLFIAADMVGLILVAIASLDWCIVRQNLSQDLTNRPWTLLEEARNMMMKAVARPIEERIDCLDEAQAKLMTITELRYRTWVTPIVLTARLEWLRYGAGYLIDSGTQDQLVSLMPDEPAPHLGLAHTLTCAWLISPKAYEGAILRAREQTVSAINLARDRSLQREVIAAGWEAHGDTYLAEHNWANAISMYQNGIYTEGTMTPGHHCLRCQQKKALAILGMQLDLDHVHVSDVRDAKSIFEEQARLVIKDSNGNIEERAPIGLQAGIAIAELLIYNPTTTVRTLDRALEEISPESSDPRVKLERMHLELCKMVTLLRLDERSYTPINHRELLDRIGIIQNQLQMVEFRDEIEYLGPALFQLSIALQAGLLDHLGEPEKAQHARKDLIQFDTLRLVGQNDPVDALTTLISAWCALEIYEQGFFQSFSERRSRVGPNFLEPEHDQTSTFYDYVFMDYQNIMDEAGAEPSRPPRLRPSDLLKIITDRLCRWLSRFTN